MSIRRSDRGAFFSVLLSPSRIPSDWNKRDKARRNMNHIMGLGFRSRYDVPGDGNCLIYSVIISLYLRIEVNVFQEIMRPFCSDDIFQVLLKNPDDVIHDHGYMREIARSIRNGVVALNDFHVDVALWMSDGAIDHQARLMVLRLLCVKRLNRYTLIPDPEFHDPDMSFDDVSSLPDLRPDVTTKFTVDTISDYGFNHYSPLFM